MKASLDGGGFNLPQKGRFAKSRRRRRRRREGGRHARRRSFWQQTQRRHRPPLIDSVSIQPSWIDNTGKLDQGVVTDVTATVTFGKATRCRDVSEDQSPSLSAAVKRSKKAVGIAHLPLRSLWGLHNHQWRRKRQRRQRFAEHLISVRQGLTKPSLHFLLFSCCIRHDFYCPTILLNHCQLCKMRNKKMKTVRQKTITNSQPLIHFMHIFYSFVSALFQKS